MGVRIPAHLLLIVQFTITNREMARKKVPKKFGSNMRCLYLCAQIKKEIIEARNSYNHL